LQSHITSVRSGTPIALAPQRSTDNPVRRLWCRKLRLGASGNFERTFSSDVSTTGAHHSVPGGHGLRSGARLCNNSGCKDDCPLRSGLLRRFPMCGCDCGCLVENHKLETVKKHVCTTHAR
jgi:hypothetical protein